MSSWKKCVLMDSELAEGGRSFCLSSSYPIKTFLKIHSRYYDKCPLRHNDRIVWYVCLTVQVHSMVRIPQLTKSFYLGPYHIRLVYELHFQLVHWELLTSSPWSRVLSVRRHYLWVAAVVIACAPEMILPDQWLYSWVCDSGINYVAMDQMSVISSHIFC